MGMESEGTVDMDVGCVRTTSRDKGGNYIREDT